ncbi:MAG: class II aldolase/adducin family protein [Gammaproteobacteria bacterium]|nr:class II aldolase/adducin family protein [Gammaproteobacteria bacterium]
MSDTPKSGGPVSADLIADLAAASRILAAQGVVDGFGHVSRRHPDAPDRYFLSRSMAPALVTPDDIIEYDLDSTACEADAPNGFSERFIHGQIYRARSEVMSVVHTHSPSVIPFGLVGAQMLAMFHNAAFLAAGVPVFDISEKFGDTDMMVTDNAKGVALAECLADKHVGLMRGHGVVTCAESLEVAVFRAFYTEVSARIQHWTQALAGDAPIAALTEAEGLLADVPNKSSSMRAWHLWRAPVREQLGW